MTSNGQDKLKTLLRRLPKVDAVVEHESLGEARSTHGRGVVTHYVRRVLDELRSVILGNPQSVPDTALDAVAHQAHQHLQRQDPLPRVLNGTGVILHSGLGRAPLSHVAKDAIARAAGYALLEVDRAEGKRLSRDARAGEILRALTGAEASLVVNNNAAATLLILSTLAGGKEVICSRGEMVEIGGSFRIPDVMEASGARLVSVGTTNKTHIEDYERAITDHTGALLVVHTSNYRIVGFSSSPPLAEIAALARRHHLPLIHDLGSGSLLTPEELGQGDEPPVKQSLTDGADVVCLSGDKLLGGPQAGIILGRRDLVDTMRNHPLARALRIDKMTAAALEATLRLFLNPETLREHHAVTHMLTVPVAELRQRAERCAAILSEVSTDGLHVAVIEITSETGSGALPTLQIPSIAVALTTHGLRPNHFARALREHHPAVFPRIQDDRICLDLRTLLPGEEEEAARIVADVFSQLKS